MKTFNENIKENFDPKKTKIVSNYFFTNKPTPISNVDNKSYKGKQMNTFLQKTKEERQTEILKLEVKKRLKDAHITFTDTPFGIFIDMTFRYHIVFSENSVGYKIYTDSGFELGCSSHNFMAKNDIFEALDWTILEINLDLHRNIPFNVYADNGEVL